MAYAEHRRADLYASRLLEAMEGSARARSGERLTEATQQQRAATGAAGYSGGYDSIDRDLNYRRHGSGGPREVPERTRERARMDSVVAARANPMGHAILETYVAFVVGDTGLTLQCSSDVVRPVAEAFWTDPRNMLPNGQELMVRSWLEHGEQLQEAMVGDISGVCRRSPIDPTRICGVDLYGGNPLWPEAVRVKVPGMLSDYEAQRMAVIGMDDIAGLRDGEVWFWPGFKATELDTRGYPFLGPIIDWLDSYDQVLSNLIDRTAIARYMVWDVTFDGDQAELDKFVKDHGYPSPPRSGSVNVHNKALEWNAKTAMTGAYEDVEANQAVLTTVAAGAGLAKTYLAEPEDANRATSLTMSEPVRRRIGSVQNEWIANITEMVRFAVDRAVAAQRIPRTVPVTDAGGQTTLVPAADTVMVTGPQVAVADAKLTAEVLVNLSQALDGLVTKGILSPAAAKIAAQKGWEDYVGIPWQSELDNPDGSTVDAIAEEVDAAGAGQTLPLVAA